MKLKNLQKINPIIYCTGIIIDGCDNACIVSSMGIETVLIQPRRLHREYLVPFVVNKDHLAQKAQTKKKPNNEHTVSYERTA